MRNVALGFSYLTDEGKILINTHYGCIDISNLVKIADWVPGEDRYRATILIEVPVTKVGEE